jgi:hypothetical protein
MRESDRWGSEPSVRAMRGVFRAMEEAQKTFLDLLCISPWDPRLRSWRRRARIAFESAWTQASSLGLTVGTEEAATLYIRCLGKILEADGVKVPEGLRISDLRFESLTKEGLR